MATIQDDEGTEFADVARMLAHDIHQSIVTAQVYAGILQGALKEGDLERAGSSAAVIESAIQQLDGMVRDIVDGILTERSGIRLECQRLDLTVFVGHVVSALTAARGIDWIRCEGSDPTFVHADPLHLRRILDNLLGNAMKYSEPGSPITARVEPQGERARLSLTDRGMGISPDDLPRVFQRGYRGRGDARRSPGLGLGLAIARFLVEAHGGQIWVESTLGNGSTFFVELPLARPAE